MKNLRTKSKYLLNAHFPMVEVLISYFSSMIFDQILTNFQSSIDSANLNISLENRKLA